MYVAPHPLPFIAATIAFASIIIGVLLLLTAGESVGLNPAHVRADGRLGVWLILAGVAGLVGVAVGMLF